MLPKPSRQEYRRAWYAKNPTKRKEYRERFHKKHPKAEYERKYAAVRRAWERKRQLAKYGLTVSDYETMLRTQNCCCAICAQPKKRLAVDHSHKTGKVRGLLCGP